MSTLLDSYSTSNYSTATSVWGTSNYGHRGHSFTTPSYSSVLSFVNFYIYRYGSPTGYCYAQLYAHTGTYGTSSLPTGSVLATSDAVDVSSVLTYPHLETFTFSGTNKISLSASTYYVVVIKYTGGDSSNQITLCIDLTSPTHSGNSCEGDGSSWSVKSTFDSIFYIYCENDVKTINSLVLSSVKSVNDLAIASVDYLGTQKT